MDGVDSYYPVAPQRKFALINCTAMRHVHYVKRRMEKVEDRVLKEHKEEVRLEIPGYTVHTRASIDN